MVAMVVAHSTFNFPRSSFIIIIISINTITSSLFTFQPRPHQTAKTHTARYTAEPPKRINRRPDFNRSSPYWTSKVEVIIPCNNRP